MSVFLSVIIPVYNVKKYLDRCMESVVGQKFKDLEIILVNDGSTDSSGLICDAWAEKDPRIQVIHQKNAGVSAARNAGIELATGEYVTFVDSDDWLAPNMYEKMCETAKSDAAPQVVMCDFVNVKGDSLENIFSSLREGYYTRKQIVSEIYPTLLVTEDFGRIPIVSVWSSMYKRSLFTHHDLFFDEDLKYSEDYLFMAEVMITAHSFYYLKHFYPYHYLQYPQSRSKKFQIGWWENLLALNTSLKKLLHQDKDFDFTRQLKLQLLHSALMVLNGIYSNNTLRFGQKIVLLREVMDNEQLRDAFQNLNFSRNSMFQKIILYLIKYRMSYFYLFFLHSMSILKKCLK